MKKILFFYLILFYVSCKKELTQATGDIAINTAKAKFNGHPWEAFGTIYKLQLEKKLITSFKMDSVFVFENNPYLRNSFGIVNPPIKVGCYTLCKADLSGAVNKGDKITALFSTAIDGGDVGGAIYDLDESKKNYLEIIYVSEDTTEVEGRFQAYFNRIGNNEPDQPAKIALTEA
ncbi:MAG: hypothetical protein RLZZ292_1418, partial [Bacteroidota bacterium]